MFDSTNPQRHRSTVPNGRPKARADLEAEFGPVWDIRGLARDFVITGLRAPYLICRRKADNVEGCLEYQRRPALFFTFKPMFR